jgi:hypothetical protein
MKLRFEIQKLSYAYQTARDIKFFQREIDSIKSGLRHTRKEKVKSKEKHIRNMEKYILNRTKRKL